MDNNPDQSISTTFSDQNVNRPNRLFSLILFASTSLLFLFLGFIVGINWPKSPIRETAVEIADSETLNSSVVKISPTIPNTAKDLFNTISQETGKVLIPQLVTVEYFYSQGKYSTQKVWQIDLGQTEKEEVTKILKVITDQFKMTQTGAADGGGHSVIYYSNDQMDCVFDFKTTDTLSCLER